MLRAEKKRTGVREVGMSMRFWGWTAMVAVTVAAGQAQPPTDMKNRRIEAVRVTAPPKIDGVLDDECWKTLPKAAPFYDNDTGALVKDQSTAWIGYDDNCFYIAFECLESRPDKIVARETKRGGNLYDDDYVSVFFNPYGTRSGSEESSFMVNSAGTQSAYIAEGRANKQEWEGEWQSAAKVGDHRWTVEIAVPWRILRHRKAGGKPVKMDVNFVRNQVWSGVYSCWSYTTMQRKAEFTGVWDGVAIPDGVAEPPLSAMWYGLSGIAHDRPQGQVGLDLRYRLDAEQTALLTLNPDFGDIEQSVTSIDFSYASKIGSETRPFFLEGQGFFRKLGSAVFTGVRVPDVDVGAKYFGKATANLDVGVLATHSGDAERTDTALCVSRRFGGYNSLDFGWVSSNEPGIENNVLMAGGTLDRGDFFVNGKYMRSDDRTGSGDAGYLGGSWNRGPLSAYAEHFFVSPDYLPRDGYVSYNDDRGVDFGANYSMPWRSGPAKSIDVGIGALRSWHYDGGLFRDSLSAYSSLVTRSDWMVFCEQDFGRFEENRDTVTWMGFYYPTSNSDRFVGLRSGFGRQDSRDYRSLRGNWVFRLDRRLKVGGVSEFVQIGGYASQHTLTLSYDVAHDQAIGGRMVMRDDVANWYLSYRKSGYKGTEYYVILGDPNAEKFQTRLVFKVVGVL